MNITSTKCHVPKASWGPVYDVSPSLPEAAGPGPSIADLGRAIDTYLAKAEAGGSTQGLHPYCPGVDTELGTQASRCLKDESEQMQDLFAAKKPQQVLLSAQDIADVLARHAVRYEGAGAEAAEKVESLTASRKKTLRIQMGSALLAGGAGVALALAAPGLPGWVPAIIGGGALLCGFDAVMNSRDQDLGSEDLATARYEVGSFAREAQASRDLGATAQAWAESLK